MTWRSEPAEVDARAPGLARRPARGRASGPPCESSSAARMCAGRDDRSRGLEGRPGRRSAKLRPKKDSWPMTQRHDDGCRIPRLSRMEKLSVCRGVGPHEYPVVALRASASNRCPAFRGSTIGCGGESIRRVPEPLAGSASQWDGRGGAGPSPPRLRARRLRDPSRIDRVERRVAQRRALVETTMRVSTAVDESASVIAES